MQKGGGLRGCVKGFSFASRRRLLRCLASIDKAASSVTPLFVTLTYPNKWDEDPKSWRKNLRAFIKRLDREFGESAVFWRLEFQKRGAPHFHLMVWDVKATHKFRKWVSLAWYRVVASQDPKHLKAGTNVQRCKSWNGASAYLSKYLAKPSDGEHEPNEFSGRCWGIENRKHLSFSPNSWLVAIKQALAIRRAMHRHARLPKKFRGGIRGFTCFLSQDCADKLRDLFAPDAYACEFTGELPLSAALEPL
jgi:hypothetical protein